MDKEKTAQIYSNEIQFSSSEKQSNRRKEIRFNPKTKPQKNSTITHTLRIRRFKIPLANSKHAEFGCHAANIHWLGDAVFNSQRGCLYCQKELEIQE